MLKFLIKLKCQRHGEAFPIPVSILFFLVKTKALPFQLPKPGLIQLAKESLDLPSKTLHLSTDTLVLLAIIPD